MQNSLNLNATVNDSARQSMTHERERVRAYLPDVLQRLLLTYGIPLLIAFVLATAGGVVISSFLPVSTTNIIVLGLNLAVLVYGWRWLERRYKATSLFLIYVRFSRERRDLDKMLKNDAAPDAIQAKQSMMEESAQNFIDAVRELGITPRKSE